MFANIELNDFKDIIDLYKKDSGEPNEAWINQGRLFIKGEENELMLRCNEFNKTLVIARIQFKNQRKGNGTLLLNSLKQYGKLNGYNTILIEALMTEEAYKFAIKNGFRKKEKQFEITEIIPYYGDYILSI